MENPFKFIEPDAECPPYLKEQIVSEIDSIRNILTVVELYAGDFFNSVMAMLTLDSTPGSPTDSKP